MNYSDYYKILGVKKDATTKEIKKAFKKSAIKYHPDKNKGNKSAEQKFQKINEAYQVLSDPDKRQKYDTLGENWDKYSSSGGGSGFSGNYNDIFSNMFGGSNRRRSQRSSNNGFSDFFQTFFGGDSVDLGGMGGGFNNFFDKSSLDHEAKIEISLSEALKGCENIYKINGKNVKVKIPKGIRNNQKIKLKNMGKSSNGYTGDLYSKIKIQNNKTFRIEGNDIILPINITPIESALGTEFVAELPFGKIKTQLPPEISLWIRGVEALKNPANQLQARLPYTLNVN